MLSPETYPIILGHEPAHDDDIDDGCNAVCLKDARGVLVIIPHAYAADTDLVITVHEGSTQALAEAGGTVLATTFPIWVNKAASTTDALVRQTDAAGYTIDTTEAANQLVVFYIPANILTAGNSWIAIGTTGGHATNTSAIIFILDGARYQQVTPPTAIA